MKEYNSRVAEQHFEMFLSEASKAVRAGADGADLLSRPQTAKALSVFVKKMAEYGDDGFMRGITLLKSEMEGFFSVGKTQAQKKESFDKLREAISESVPNRKAEVVWVLSGMYELRGTDSEYAKHKADFSDALPLSEDGGESVIEVALGESLNALRDVKRLVDGTVSEMAAALKASGGDLSVALAHGGAFNKAVSDFGVSVAWLSRENLIRALGLLKSAMSATQGMGGKEYGMERKGLSHKVAERTADWLVQAMRGRNLDEVAAVMTGKVSIVE